jgi:hypothetical protein
MNIYHEQELVHLICQEWDARELLNDHKLSDIDKESIQEKIEKYVYQIAELTDLYQNRFIKFDYMGKLYNRYSDVLKDCRFDLNDKDTLLKQIFELKDVKQEQIIKIKLQDKQMDNWLTREWLSAYYSKMLR